MKEFIIYNSLNLYSIVVLVIIYFQARMLLKANKDFQSKIWLGIIYLLSFIILADIFSWLYLQNSNPFLITLSKIFNCIIYTLAIPLTTQIALFVDFSVRYSKSGYNYLKRLFLPLIIINAVLSLLSYFFNIYFTYESGSYETGAFNFISAIFIFAPIIFVLVRIILLQKDIKQIKVILIFGLIFPVFFLIIHRVFTLPFTSFFASITLSIIVYNFLLINNNLNMDFLTGLQNRRGIDKYFSSLTPQLQNYFTVIFIDINGFKSINDKYGHSEGDIVLVMLAKMITKVVISADLAARIGGDEFIIAMQSAKEKEYQTVIDKLHSEIQEFNTKENKPYKLGISFGVSINRPETRINKDKIIEEADAKMYKHKMENKQ